MQISSLSERIPIEETIKTMEYVKWERDIEKVKRYIDEIMPFGDKATAKYRNKLIQRFLKLDGDTVIYSPLLQYINGVESYQTKKEILYFIVCTTSDAVGEVVKGFYKGDIPAEIDDERLLSVFKEAMPKAKESSYKKTFSVVNTVLQDFGIVRCKKDRDKNMKIFYLNENVRPSYQGILFSICYEFLHIKGNKMPDVEKVLGCDTFKYFLVNDLVKKRYIKWMTEKGFIERYDMGGNAKYQFALDSLESLCKKVVEDDG
ncbi:hypothetical protein PRVXH_001820 [Proteinivorax hydrogeniformans]|uniref:Uncharacterized protein n=1 Tax=Proteinivorax hydrogeniformans TaxID=1826727 RepID=A0AAU8HRX9_9FIRM